MSDASSTDTPQAVDHDEAVREGQKAENARMAAETKQWGGKTTGSVPWADEGDKRGDSAPSSKKRPAPTPAPTPASGASGPEQPTPAE